MPGRALIAVGGQIASGKSTVAAAIGARLRAAVIGSDGLRAVAQAWEDRSGSLPHEMTWVQEAPSVSVAIYQEMMREADLELGANRPVVLDGCFARRTHRGAARQLAQRHAAPFLFVECLATPNLVDERLGARDERDGLPPGSWLELARDFEAHYEKVDELAAEEHVVVTTSISPDEIVRREVAPRLDPGLFAGATG